MKNVIVRWTAVYETTIKMANDADIDDMHKAAAEINTDVKGAVEQPHTFEIEYVREATNKGD